MIASRRIHASIIAIVIFNFSWLAFHWLNPHWRALTSFLQSIHMAGFDVYAINSLTLLLISLGIVQIARRRAPEDVIRGIADVLMVLIWVATYGAIVISNLSPG